MSDFRGSGRSQKEIMDDLQQGIEDVDFMAIATPCSVKSCNQHDFLPCKCQECGVVTCRSHLRDHDCSKPIISKEVPQCPLCSKFVFVKSSEDVNVVMDEHISSSCKSKLLKDHTKKNKKKKCPVKGCKQRLLFPVECASCREQYCTSHRFPDHHDCMPVSCHSQARRRSKKGSSSSSSSTPATSTINTIRNHWQRIYAQTMKQNK
eukprot:m.126997 g.126997  ORF g.126997 m.126997 type:complete len:206 (+) comp9440_c0_seq1:169-786(+)